MAKKKIKIGGVELPYEFDTVEELNEWGNSTEGAEALEEYFQSEQALGNYGPFFIEF